MLRIIVLLLFAISVAHCFAQTPPKKEVKKNLPSEVPSKSGMLAQMAEAINELNKQIVDLEKQIAEAKKNKEDESVITDLQGQVTMLKKQVDMMNGVNKSMSGITEKKFAKAVAQENHEGVPERDDARINTISKKVLTNTEMVAFVQKVYSALDKELAPLQKINGKEIYNEYNAKEKSPALTGTIAVQCWLAGSTDVGLYLLGRACLDDLTNTDNLCNYASLLSMVGGEHLAIPILQNLDQRFPGNSTILNNLGQAWFGLGDMNNANRFIDSTMHFAGAAHSQANETKAEIQDSEGNQQESIESLKRSIKTDYTPEKEARLNKMGVKLIHTDIDDPECSKDNGAGSAQSLGIEEFLFGIPDYPFAGGTVAETARWLWSDFREKLNAAKSILLKEKEIINQEVKAYEAKLVVKQRNGEYETNSALLKPYNTKQYKTASRKLTLLTEWATDRLLDLAKKMMAAGDTIQKWKEVYNKALQATEDCGAKFGLATTFNANANALWNQRNDEWLNFHKQYLNQQSHLVLCAFTDASLYKLNMLNIKETFLITLAGLRCEFEVGCTPSEPERPMGKILPDFDEMNCQYKTDLTLSVPGKKNFSINVECNKMTTEFDLKFIKGSLEENLATGKYKGRVELEQKIGSDDFKLGPVKMGTAKLSAGAGVEFNEGGIQDVYITGSASLKAGAVTMSSANARVSVITGNSSITGGGALSGIRL